MLSVALVTADFAGGAVPPAVPDSKTLQRAFSDADAAAFREPSRVYRPETWFHFIGGNVATQGITADLEAIAGAGIEGIQLFHGQFGGAWPGVEPQIQCLSGPWDGAVSHVAKECRRLGLRFTMQNCPGWAMAGGPWITPEKAMRDLVWSRADVIGGSNVTATLPQPQPSGEEWRDYREVAVVAFPTPEGDTGRPLAPVSVKSNREDLPWEKCLRNDKDGKIVLEPGKEPAWLEATFASAVTLRTVELPSVQGFNHQWCYVPGVTIKVEAVLPEGLREVARYDMPESNWQDNKPISLACSEVPARTYRITIEHQHTMNLPYVLLFSGARKNNWESEAAFTLRGLERVPHPLQEKTAWIDPARIVDLTDKMDARGTLRWDAPPGRWTVLRWGHVNAGKRNGPAPTEGTGWECDKLSAAGAETHFSGYIGRLAGKNGPVSGLMQGMLMDSWECETQTWTPGMDGQFARLRGYPLKRWFPALAGYVVGDPETTTRFLRDWRATINDLVVENFFGRMASLGRQNGLAVSYETAPGDVFPADILEYYKHADVPMCEFWQPRTEAFVGSFEFKPVKPCVSAARMYGKSRVAAESFTSFNLTWNEHPGMLKHVADIHLAEGVTHLVFHTYTHNPRTDWLPPGTAFGSGIGTPFLRGQTWWAQMGEFTAYLARCGLLLERGRPVSDVLWYLGDEQDHKPRQDAPFPAGYHYDYCNPDALLTRLSVRDGRIVTPEGLSYRVLWLRDSRRMLPETLEKMVSLVKQGAVLLGERPHGLATLSGGKAAEKRFGDALETLWGAGAQGVRRVGKGTVVSGMSLDDALVKLGIKPDVEGNGVVWTHRQTDGADWYFVAAPAREGFRGTLRFRAGGAVELWNPLTGAAMPAGVVRREGETSLVALELPPSGSVFVVFRKAVQATAKRIVRLEHEGLVVADAQVPCEVATGTGLQVVSASYGDPADNARRKDVTESVRQDLARGQSTITADNSWAGGDPALRTVKKLFVVMRLPDGTEKRFEAREGEPLTLVDLTPIAHPACEVLDGGARLLAWEPGAYRATREDGTISAWETRSPRSVPLAGAWKLDFPAGWGAPASVRMDQLTPWTEMDIPPEGKAFSGTATYSTEFTLDSQVTGSRLELDLGRVEVIASVRLNGQPAGTIWTPPYRLDVTRLAKPGVNRLTVEVTSTWFNRLAYDAGLEENARKTWTISGPAKGSPLVPTGLLGPVIVRRGQILDASDAR